MAAMNLALRLWMWRTHRGLTLQQVSDRSGVSLTMLTKAECDQRDLSTKSLVAVAEKAIGVTMSRFWATPPKVRPPVGRAGAPRTTSKPLIGAGVG